MKIVFLLTQDLESPSGLGRYYPLARELAALGHRVTIYALHSNYSGLERKSFDEGNLTVRYIAQMHVMKRGSRKIYFGVFALLGIAARATAALTFAALRERPDILWAGKPHPMNGVAWVVGRLRWGCQLFLDCDDDEAGSGNFSSPWQRRLVGWFESRLPKLADRVTTNTQHTLDRLLRLGIPPERIYYLSNGIDASRFAAEPDPAAVERLRASLGLAEKKVIGYVGSLSLASHAVDLLVAAFEIVVSAIPQAHLLLVGGGEDLDKLRNMVAAEKMENQVHFTGRVAPDQVQLYYQLMDVCVDPVQDNAAARGRSPLKLFEAWGSACPVVTSGVGDRSYLAGDPPAVELVTPEDEQALATGIIKVLDDERIRADLIQRGKERLKTFGWDHLTRQLITQLGD